MMLKTNVKKSAKLPQFLHTEQEEKTDTNPERVYYDVVITNVKSTTTEPPIAYFNESRNNPFVNCPSDYYLSVIRFSLDTQTLPIFIPAIQAAQPDINLTEYSITLTYNGFTSAETFVEWVPQVANAPIPAVPAPYQDNSTGYYNCYNYQYIIYQIQRAIVQAFNSLAALTVLPTDKHPVLSWDTQNSILVITAESSTYNRSLANPILMYWNAPLFTLFNTLVARYEGYSPTLNGKNFLIIIDDFTGTSTIRLPTSAPYEDQYVATQVFQESSTTNNFCPVSSIVFCSNTLPIVSNQLSAPLVLNNLAQLSGSNTGNNSNFAQIISDFETGGNTYTPYILYNPTAEYRLIDMYGSTPLVNLDISIFWKSRLGELQPFRLASGASATIKLMFQKKNIPIQKKDLPKV